MAMPLIIGAGVLNTLGTLASGQEAERVGNANADALQGQAGAVRAATVSREGMVRARSQRDLASQRAALNQSGVSPTTGTALVGVRQSTYDAELDALTTRYEGLLQAQGLDTQASMSRYEGKARKKQSRMSAAAQLVGTAASAYFAGGMGTQAPAPISSAPIRWL
jgi:hypothetical protein